MIILLITLLLMMIFSYRSNLIRFSIIAFFFTTLYCAYYFGWAQLEIRLSTIFTDKMSNRLQIYETVLRMIDDYGIYGSGPGSFEAIIQFEIGETLKRWETWAHNDYLEYYLTFGLLGSAIIITLIIAILTSIFINYFVFNIELPVYILVAFFGVAISAAGDFPLQVHSILILIFIIAGTFSSSHHLISNIDKKLHKN